MKTSQGWCGFLSIVIYLNSRNVTAGILIVILFKLTFRWEKRLYNSIVWSVYFILWHCCECHSLWELFNNGRSASSNLSTYWKNRHLRVGTSSLDKEHFLEGGHSMNHCQKCRTLYFEWSREHITWAKAIFKELPGVSGKKWPWE